MDGILLNNLDKFWRDIFNKLTSNKNGMTVAIVIKLLWQNFMNTANEAVSVALLSGSTNMGVQKYYRNYKLP